MGIKGVEGGSRESLKLKSRIIKQSKKSKIEYFDYLIIWNMWGLLQQKLVGKLMKESKESNSLNFYFFWYFFFYFFLFFYFWIFEFFILLFFVIFFYFLLIMPYTIKGQWKTDKHKRIPGQMTIIPFPVLFLCHNALKKSKDD